MRSTTGHDGGRPEVTGRRAMVASGHYLATEIGVHILRSGGNAFDAAVAAGVALQVLKPHQNGFGGENPTLLYSARAGKAWALSGHGGAPRAATIAKMRELGVRMIPGDGYLGAVVPPAVGTYLFLLAEFGTMTVAEVLEPAAGLAGDGFAMYDALRGVIGATAERMRRDWPSSAAVYLPGGAPLPVGAVLRNEDLGRTLRRLIEASTGKKTREAGIEAARKEFYEGAIAREMLDFATREGSTDATGERHVALLAAADLAAYRPRLEEAARVAWHGLRRPAGGAVTTTRPMIEVLKCPTWTQGPAMLAALSILEQFDVAAMGLNSVEYIHTVVEAMKLAYADREFFYGDPDFVDVPLGRLLSKEYARERAAMIGDEASLALRPGLGRPELTGYDSGGAVDAEFARAAGDGGAHGDTTKLDIIDGEGNAISITTSGGWLQSSPVIPGLGFPLGTRGQMFSLVAGHPNCLEPGKRPRSTLTPTMMLEGGRPRMVFGSPGGDCQDQWALEFLLGRELFGLGLQEAVEAPTFWSSHWPNSFYPRACVPGELTVESRIEESVVEGLRERGHKVKAVGAFGGGNTLAVEVRCEGDGRVLSGAASPRLEPAYAMGY